MTVSEIMENVDEVQGEFKIVYYDEDKNERVELTEEQDPRERRVQFIYCEDNVLYFEVEMWGQSDKFDRIVAQSRWKGGACVW